MYSIIGCGFIGNHFANLYPECSIKVNSGDFSPKSKDIIYLRSTSTNYNILTDPYIDIEVNLRYLIHTLTQCDSSHTINFISSWFIFGDQEILPAKENAAARPRGFYSITKKAAEDLLISYCRTKGINYRIIRLCNVIGEGDKASKQKNALQYLIGELKANKPIKLYNKGNFIRDYLHVEDVCAGIKLISEKGEKNEIYNLGSGNPYVFQHLINYCYNRLNSKSEVTSIEPPEFHAIVQVKDFYMDVSKVTALGFKPKMDIFQSLEKVL